jgi:hypothetical protein
MFSSVSKLADKNFIIGFFVPALIAFLTVVYAFKSVTQIGALFGTIAASDKDFAQLTYVAAAVWVMALVLLIFNNAFYRILEGYTPPFAWFPKMIARHQAAYRSLRLRHDYLINAGNRAAASRITWKLNQDYPSTEGMMLPTRFGNRIRAFTLYPNDLYGADGATLWPRLLSVLPTQVVDSINDARAQMNCMMNVCFLALFVAGAAVIRLAYEAIFHVLVNPPDAPKLVWVAVLSCTVSYIGYLSATASVLGWGETVKSAFDCFLPELAKQLGYALPEKESNRKKFWDAIARLVLYRKPLVDGAWPPAAPSPNGLETSKEATGS